ncbi:MAG: pyridoxamine 5'-phosphate oxidase family protein [Streptosporangiales bacterium]
MDQQDIDKELCAPGARKLLGSTSAAHLAYTGKDGTPRVIPVGFFWTGEQFVVATATTAPKVAALSARPDVALAIDAGDTPEQARALSIRGRASVQIVDGVVPEYLAAARQTMDTEAADEFERNCRQMYDQQARIAITPHWVRYYDFGAGRMPRFLQDLAEQSSS